MEEITLFIASFWSLLFLWVFCVRLPHYLGQCEKFNAMSEQETQEAFQSWRDWQIIPALLFQHSRNKLAKKIKASRKQKQQRRMQK